MENLEKQYSEIDKEIIGLALHRKKVLLKIKAEGMLSKEQEDDLIALEGIPQLVNERVLHRLDIEKKNAEQEQRFMETRTILFCSECKAKQNVVLLREMKHPEFGWIHDEVECTVCNTHFVATAPNNWKDRKLFFRNKIEELTLIREDGETLAEKMMDKERVKNDILLFRNFLKAQEDAEIASKDADNKRELAEKASEHLRDLLLQDKLLLGSWKNNIGLA